MGGVLRHRAGEPAPVDGRYRVVTWYGPPLGAEIRRLRGEPFPLILMLHEEIGIDVRFVLVEELPHMRYRAA